MGTDPGAGILRVSTCVREGGHEECSRKKGQHIEQTYRNNWKSVNKLRLRDPSRPQPIQAPEMLSKNLVPLLRAVGSH